MREIKFRAWSTQGEPKMIQLVDGKIGGRLNDLQEEDDWKVMQYTGLKDKNGDNEIYECDIIDSDGNVIGNQYETPALLEEKTNLLIQGFGTKAWLSTYKEAVERGCYDA